MGIEFTTTINDYTFSDIPEKVLTALKESLANTMLFEKVPVYASVKSKHTLENQTYWSLI